MTKSCGATQPGADRFSYPSRDEILAAIREQKSLFDFERDVPPSLRADRDIVLAAFADATIEFRHVPTTLHSDREVMLAAAKCGFGGNLEALPDVWKDDAAFVTELMRDKPGCFEHASERVRSLREVALAAVATVGKGVVEWDNLRHVPPPLNRDRELLTTALRGHLQAYVHVPEDLRADPELLALAAEHSKGNSLVFEAMPASARDDREIVLKMVSRDGGGFEHASERLRDDKELLLVALAGRGRVLQYASARLRADPEVARVVAASKDCSAAFAYLDPAVRSAPDMVAQALANHADLKDFSEALRDDEATVRIAVAAWGRNYEAASDRLKAVREIALLAAQDHTRGITWGFDLSWAPESLRADKEIARNAVLSEDSNAKHLPQVLLQDHAFLRELVAANDRVLEHLPAEAARAVALARIVTGAHHGRRIVAAAVPATGSVYDNQRKVETLTVEDPSGSTLRVTSMPVLTYEKDGPVGSYLSVRYVVNVVLCGAFVFLVEENTGDKTSTYRWAVDRTSEEEAIRTHLWHHVYLVPWSGADGSVTDSFDSLRGRSLLLYEGRTARLPIGVSAFPGQDGYTEAMSLLGGSAPRQSKYATTGPRELTIAAAEAHEVGGAARVYVQGEGEGRSVWRWLIPHAEGPRAALAILGRTTHADDWRWLQGQVEGATPAQRGLLATHFAGVGR